MAKRFSIKARNWIWTLVLYCDKAGAGALLLCGPPEWAVYRGIYWRERAAWVVRWKRG